MGKPTTGSLVIKDNIGVIASWFGHRQSDKTLVSSDSRQILIRVEALDPPVPELKIEDIVLNTHNQQKIAG